MKKEPSSRLRSPTYFILRSYIKKIVCFNIFCCNQIILFAAILYDKTHTHTHTHTHTYIYIYIYIYITYLRSYINKIQFVSVFSIAIKLFCLQQYYMIKHTHTHTHTHTYIYIYIYIYPLNWNPWWSYWICKCFMYFHTAFHVFNLGIVAETILRSASLHNSWKRAIHFFFISDTNKYGPVAGWFERCIDQSNVLYVAWIRFYCLVNTADIWWRNIDWFQLLLI